MIDHATDPQAWDAFLDAQPYSPFLQSWSMGEVYRELKQEPIRLTVKDGNEVTGICMALIVPARRGRHLSIPYGPVLKNQHNLGPLLDELKKIAKEKNCSFIRMSPHWKQSDQTKLRALGAIPSPLHLLAEHIWYLPLTESDPWASQTKNAGTPLTEEQLMAGMRSTTRNLIRRAQKDGVTVERSNDPTTDLHHFLKLHDETRKRHGFTPYTDAFFRAQIARFHPRNECSLYLAKYQDEVIAASIHMHAFGETSYHHGASSYAHRKVPASYLIQWTAILDALKRGDSIYNFWGIAPMEKPQGSDPNLQSPISHIPRHPFAGVTLFKTGFGGKLLDLTPCMDLPLSGSYWLTRGFETVRKWKRGF